MIGNPLIWREKRSTAATSIFSVRASLLLLFGADPGSYGSEIGAAATGGSRDARRAKLQRSMRRYRPSIYETQPTASEAPGDGEAFPQGLAHAEFSSRPRSCSKLRYDAAPSPPPQRQFYCRCASQEHVRRMVPEESGTHSSRMRSDDNARRAPRAQSAARQSIRPEAPAIVRRSPRRCRAVRPRADEQLRGVGSGGRQGLANSVTICSSEHASN
jgi:hypothetical protein